jgi:pimeloyl-ACP methyl ester carboxylesterase
MKKSFPLLFVLWLDVFVAILPAQFPQAGWAQSSDAAKSKPFVVEVTGHGRGMILIPGLTCGGDVWKGAVEHYRERYECHVLTLAGFAGQPPIEPPMLETIRKDIVTYIKEKKLIRPVVVGHSLGGFLAFWIAATNPDLVGPVVSVDGGTFYPALRDPSATVESSKSGAEGTRQMMAGQTPEQFATQSKMFLGGMITDPKNVELIAPTCAKSDPKAVGLAMYELSTTDLREDVARIKTPVLLIGSGAFATTPEMRKKMEELYEAQVARIPTHKVLLADKARHFIMLDDPKLLFSAMDDFLRGPSAK